MLTNLLRKRQAEQELHCADCFEKFVKSDAGRRALSRHREHACSGLKSLRERSSAPIPGEQPNLQLSDSEAASLPFLALAAMEEEDVGLDNEFEAITSHTDSQSTLQERALDELLSSNSGEFAASLPVVAQLASDMELDSFYPYANATQAMLHLLRIHLSELSDRKWLTLLLTVSHSLFRPQDVPRTLTAFNKPNSLLPTVEPIRVGVSQTVVVRSKRAPVAAKQDLSVTPQLRVKQIEVLYLSFIAKLERQFNDPSTRPRLRFNAGGTGAVFAKSWFAQEPRIFRENLAFWQNNREFRVSTFAQLRGGAIVRIDSLFYRAGDWQSEDESKLVPPLIAKCTRVVEAKRLRGQAALSGAADDDLVLTNETSEHVASEFVQPLRWLESGPESKRAPAAGRAPAAAAAGTVRCRWRLVPAPVVGHALLPYRHETVVFTLNGMKDGLYCPFMQLFIDGFSTRRSRARSATGIYMRIIGTARPTTLMLLPPGVDLWEALAEFRKDCLRAAEGITVMDYFSMPIRQQRFPAYFATVLSDHVQACENCRHLGNNANLNCRSCWMLKAHRLETALDLWSSTVTRRQAQSDVVVSMIDEEALRRAGARNEREQAAIARGDRDGKKGDAAAQIVPSDSVLAEVRRKYGLRNERDPFGGTGIDPHLAPRDPDHLLKFGLTLLLLTVIWKSLTGKAKKEISKRLQYFDWPSGFRRITFDIVNNVGARYSMEATDKLLLVVRTACLDLLPDDHRTVLLNFCEMRDAIYAGYLDDAALARVQELAVRFIDSAIPLYGDELDRPNIHNLLEFVYRDLKIWRSAELCSTSAFERHHQVPKQFTDLSRALLPESFALLHGELVDTVAHLINGAVYVVDGKPRLLGAGLRGLRDAREWRAHQPHPLLLAFTYTPAVPRPLGVAPNSEAASTARLVGFGCWQPVKYVYRQWSSGDRSGEFEQLKLGEKEFRLLADTIAHSLSSVDAKALTPADVTILRPRGLLDNTSSRPRRLRVGDDVRVRWHGSWAVARIAQLWEVLLPKQNTRLLLYVPQWFVQGDKADIDSQTRLPLFKGYSNNNRELNFPHLTSDIIEQVMMVHCCLRQCEKKYIEEDQRRKIVHDQATCKCQRCRIAPACAEHLDPHCKVADCQRTMELRDCHDPTIQSWVMLDRARGFAPDRVRKSTAARAWTRRQIDGLLSMDVSD